MLLLVTVIVVENFCTWAVSAGDRQKAGYTPLQDNVALGLDAAFAAFPPLRLWMQWGVDMHWLLYAFVGLCLSVLWDQVRGAVAWGWLAGWLAGLDLRG